MSEKMMYVMFEEGSGKITGITPRKDVKNSIPLPLSKAIGFLEGTERRKNYRVEYNPKVKNLELVNIRQERFDGRSVSDFIYEIPEESVENVDIMIEQDILQKCWRIKIGHNLKKNLKNKGVNLSSVLSFSITEKHDPNILFKTLDVNFSKLMKKNYEIFPFESEFEFCDIPISIFTARKFDTYQFKRIFNE
jgi:hypothetical protein